ncbi:UNVERIFIED_CONTAM: hypothetical protein RMT77_012088 [Armadillidium vulgare]
MKVILQGLIYHLFTLNLLSGFPSSDLKDVLKEEVENKQNEGQKLSPLTDLKVEHRGLGTRPVDVVMDKVLSSKTMEVVDKAASSMVKLAGGVVEDLGDFFVQTIDQLPKTIEKLSSAVGKAVGERREKVILSNGSDQNQENIYLRNSTKKLATAVENSEFNNSLQKLEDAFASLVGKFIGVTYKNANNISTAFNNGIKRITGTNENDELEILSRSY